MLFAFSQVSNNFSSVLRFSSRLASSMDYVIADDCATRAVIDVHVGYKTHKFLKTTHEDLNAIQKRLFEETKLLYIRTLSDDRFKIVRCDRFTSYSFTHSQVIAQKQIKKRTSLHTLFGRIAKIDEEDFKSKYHDFSSSKHGETTCLFLGAIAYVNHDCNPNCVYRITSGNAMEYHLETKRNIEPDEELTVSYGSEYFSHKKYCKCRSCAMGKLYSE